MTWRFYARDPAAFREWQAYYAAGNRRAPEPAQPQWWPLADTMAEASRRSAVKARAIELSAKHGVVKAVYRRHAITVFENYIVDRSPRSEPGEFKT